MTNSKGRNVAETLDYDIVVLGAGSGGASIRLPDRGPRSQTLRPPLGTASFVRTKISSPVDIATAGTQTEVISSRA